MAAEHGDAPPRELEALLALPGVGPYTAAAVASFAYGLRVPVVDTNIRRVLARAVLGVESTTPNARRDAEVMERVLPADAESAKLTNVAVMELGALVCKPRDPDCGACPIRDDCAWRASGYPAAARPRRTQPRFEGSDRQLRGRAMRLLREADVPLPRAAFDAVAPEPDRVDGILVALERDGLAVSGEGGWSLPA